MRALEMVGKTKEIQTIFKCRSQKRPPHSSRKADTVQVRVENKLAETAALPLLYENGCHLALYGRATTPTHCRIATDLITRAAYRGPSSTSCASDSRY